MDSSDVDVNAHNFKLRNLREDDFADVKAIMDVVYPSLGGSWTKNQFNTMLMAFADGQICLDDNGRVVAATLSVTLDYMAFGDEHTGDEIVGNAHTNAFDPNGDVLYGIGVCVHPEYSHLRLGQRLYEALKELCGRLNLRAIVVGGRIPNYQHYADTHTPKQYIDAVQRQEFYDPILTFQLSNNFRIKRVLKTYMPEDQEFQGYATLLEWSNVHYDPIQSKSFGVQKKTARIGCIQWKMRTFVSVEDFLQQVEYFVEALSDHQCDVAVFPDLFNAPLMASGNDNSPFEAIRFLATFTNAILDAISQLAVSYNINIVAGSMPVIEDTTLFSVAHLCRRDGTVDQQYKLHPTPHEKKDWAMEGGHSLNVFETDFGRMGILIGYDVEFPELARLLREKEVQILLVPFWTDTKNGYLRVRRCAQARAIENECYVAIAGSIGNLPKVDNVDIQYAQTAVFSPSDFSFPNDAIMAETTPNTEMTLVVDVDLEKLQVLQHEGSVRNFLDRRRDLYSVKWTGDTNRGIATHYPDVEALLPCDV